MKMISMLFLLSHLIIYSSCLSDTALGPGYKWDLFENTDNWDLAKAVSSEDTASIKTILGNHKVNVNLQEPKFGRTLLMLAVGNDKPLSTEALLEGGANVACIDSEDEKAIHEAVKFINLKKNTYKIIQLLIKYGADVNSISKNGPISVPLEGAVNDSSCFKLLLENGANPYYQNEDKEYVVWSSLITNFGDALLNTKYLIIDKKIPVPKPILFAIPGSVPRDIIDLLHIIPVSNDSKKESIKQQIINYLEETGYPARDIYNGGKSSM